MTTSKKILLIGGGSGGHIMPLIPLMHELHKKNHKVFLVVADQEIDHSIVKDNIPDFVKTYSIKTGKLRRYFSFENFVDIFRTFNATFKAKKIIQNINPDVLFIKGGYVGVPFVIANILFRLKKDTYSHESDSSPGLATKIAKKHAKKHFYNFGEDAYPLFYIPKGIPQNPYTFKNKKPNLLIFGGSLGGLFINKLFEQHHKKILEKFNTTIITGKGKALSQNHENLQQFEIIPASDMANYISFADIIVSRGGANSLFEIVNAKVPSIIIPLPSASSRNDQFHNATYFADLGLCKIFQQEDHTEINFVKFLEKTYQDKSLEKNLQKTDIRLKAKEIAEIITSS